MPKTKYAEATNSTGVELTSEPFYGETEIKAYNQRQKSAAEKEASPTVISFTPFDGSKIQRIIPIERIDLGYSIAHEEWHGSIIENRDEVFVAKLYDLKGIDSPIIAEFERSDFPVEDRTTLRVGTPIQWTVGRKVESHGQVSFPDVVMVKNIPVWKDWNPTKAAADVKKYAEFLHPKPSTNSCD